MGERQHYDVIVIGVGMAGSSACYHLAKRGVRVLGLEQFDIPNTLASHHGFSRMLRVCYFEHADYVPLLKRAVALWREIERESGQDIFHAVGGLYMARQSSALLGGCIGSARQHDLPHDLLDHGATQRRFPQFDLPDDFVAMLDHEAGYVIPELAVATHAELAARHGATIRTHEAVTSWTTSASSVSVTTSRDTYHADRVVFAGGAWTSKLVRDLGVELRVSRQTLAWVWPKSPAMFERGTLPVWLIEEPDGLIQYGFPMLPDNLGFKLACHSHGTPADPDTIDRATGPDDEAVIRRVLQRYIPQADGPLMSMRTCMYTNTPDEHFILDRHPHHANVIIASPCSGHGFKFQPVIGQILADLALKGSSPLPVEFLKFDRLHAQP